LRSTIPRLFSWLRIADIDALVDCFKARSPVAPGPQDRIVRLD
jgi:hypothetical protein